MELTNGQMVVLLSINAVIGVIAILTCIKWYKESDNDM